MRACLGCLRQPWRMIRSTKGRRKTATGFGRRRRAKEQLRVKMCSRPKPPAGIWRPKAKRRTPRYAQKATAINGRRSATSLMPMGIWHWATKGKKSKGSLNKSHVFWLDWIRSLGCSRRCTSADLGMLSKMYLWRSMAVRLQRKLGMDYPWWPKAR